MARVGYSALPPKDMGTWVCSVEHLMGEQIHAKAMQQALMQAAGVRAKDQPLPKPFEVNPNTGFVILGIHDDSRHKIIGTQAGRMTFDPELPKILSENEVKVIKDTAAISLRAKMTIMVYANRILANFGDRNVLGEAV